MGGGYSMLAETKSLNEECGVFGIWGDDNASQLTYFGLHSLQHRGQEGAGIVSCDEGKLLVHRNLGLISEVFKDEADRSAKIDREPCHRACALLDFRTEQHRECAAVFVPFL